MSAVTVEAHQRTVPIDGVDLATWEGGAGPSVLLIHGTGARLWGELPERLAARHRVIEYDRRSFGRSVHPPLADTSRHTLDASALLGALGAAPAIVVGWSIGGVIALELAARHRELVEGLVLIEPPLHAKRHPRPAMVRALAGVKPVAWLRGERAAAERFLHWALMETSGETSYDRAPADARATLLDNAGAIVRELDAGTGEHMRARELRSIDCPAVCLVGDRSNRSLRSAADRTARLVPNCELHPVAGSGHAMQFDRPDAIVEAVERLSPARTGM